MTTEAHIKQLIAFLRELDDLTVEELRQVQIRVNVCRERLKRKSEGIAP